MCLLIETLKIENKTLQNIDGHNFRFNQARKALFGAKMPLNLTDFIDLNLVADNGIYKCSMIYKANIQKITITAYAPKLIKSLQLVTCNTIEYAYKYHDRSLLNQLKNNAKADDVLIVKNKEVTDLSYANIVFFTSNNEAFTPANPLLKGCMRSYLLAQRSIKERKITIADLGLFNRAKPINAMLNFEETPFIDLSLLT